MKEIRVVLFAVLITAPLLLNAEETEETVNFGLDTPVNSKEFLPDSSELGLSAPSFENTKTTSKDAFDLSETERRSTSQQREYEQALSAIEEARKAVKHRQEVAAQSQAFSKEFLSMNLYTRDFLKRFEEIQEKYPLAGEEEFCARLIEKGKRIQAAAEAKEALAGEGVAENQ